MFHDALVPFAERRIIIMKQIDDTVILTKIYIVAKTHLEILQEKEGVANE